MTSLSLFITSEENIFLLLKEKVQIPEVLLDIIFSFIPNRIKVFLNKDFYFQFHSCFYDAILSRNKENFIRFILR